MAIIGRIWVATKGEGADTPKCTRLRDTSLLLSDTPNTSMAIRVLDPTGSTEVIVGVDADPANAGKITEWCKDHHDALHPYSAGGAYVNFMMDEGQERIQASFRDN